MSRPCPRCGVPAPVVVSSDGALPPELVMADQVSRLREALEQVDGDVARRCAEAVAPLITALVHVVEECREEYCNAASGGPSACVVCSIARAALAAGKREGGGG